MQYAVTAKLFKNGSSQAVRLPREFRFEGEEVIIYREGNRAIVKDCTSRLVALDWNTSAAETYGQLRAGLEGKGNIIGNMDMMIAAHALALGATVITHNTRHFTVVPKLKTANWA